jgi:hypothetical protein
MDVMLRLISSFRNEAEYAGSCGPRAGRFLKAIQGHI